MEGAYISSLALVHTPGWHLLWSTHQDALGIASTRAERVCATKEVSAGGTRRRRGAQREGAGEEHTSGPDPW